ncbi:MAG TPA: hypothetical protein PKZ84_13730 [Anaerolineae bacterium]|nr:hypothetical protein [Anaerolineae bacterium]HQI85919.1 hypothetical protein [Anaerolineae bacterium]
MTQDPFYESNTPTSYQAPPAPEKKNRTWLIIIIVAVVLLLCCCVVAAGYLLWTYGDQILYELGLSSLITLIN